MRAVEAHISGRLRLRLRWFGCPEGCRALPRAGQGLDESRGSQSEPERQVEAVRIVPVLAARELQPFALTFAREAFGDPDEASPDSFPAQLRMHHEGRDASQVAWRVEERDGVEAEKASKGLSGVAEHAGRRFGDPDAIRWRMAKRCELLQDARGLDRVAEVTKKKRDRIGVELPCESDFDVEIGCRPIDVRWVHCRSL